MKEDEFEVTTEYNKSIYEQYNLTVPIKGWDILKGGSTLTLKDGKLVSIFIKGPDGFMIDFDSAKGDTLIETFRFYFNEIEVKNK